MQRSNDSMTENSIPDVIHLNLAVRDPEAVAELALYSTGTQQEQFALGALRIGILSLRQASGQIDRDVIKQESGRMLLDLGAQLRDHSSQLNHRLAEKLKEYFDPQTGRLEERIHRLVSRDGELEQLMRNQIGGESQAA